MAQTLYKLFYWPGIPGRGEFVRLLLEDAKIPYIDVVKSVFGFIFELCIKGPKEGAQAIIKVLNGEEGGLPAFAPPILQDGDQFISQSTNICLYLAKKYSFISTTHLILLAVVQFSHIMCL
jgi:glutathione S-transferase